MSNLVSLIILSATVCVGAVSARQAASLQVLKIVAGPAGSEANGTFVFTEERSIFSRTADQEVIVMFQWQGTPGPHKLTAQWRNPDGSASSNSTVDYVAKEARFGAYWRIGLTPSMATGTWSIEATVDGQPAGRFTFEVRDEKVAGVINKPALTEAELYERLNRLFVVLERSTVDGQRLNPAAGFRSAGRVITSMAALDGADLIRAASPDGSLRAVDSVLGWHRTLDWAVLSDPGSAAGEISVAAASSLKIGLRCFSMEASSPGSRVLIEGGISGHSELPGSGKRMIVRFLNGSGTTGAPLVNEYGELIGHIGAGVPGVTREMDVIKFRGQFNGAPVVPISIVRPRAEAAAEKISDLQARGDLVLPLFRAEDAMSGGFARQIVRGPSVMPSDQREQFTTSEKTFSTFVTWNPRDQRLKGNAAVRVFNSENKVVIESKPSKLDVRKGQLILSSWQVPVPSQPGIYRVDVSIDNKPIWRGFVTITG